MLTGRIIDAAEAYRIKLVHEVVAPDELMAAALKMARSIVENNAYGVWQTKIGLNTALDAPSLRHAKQIENRTQILSGFTNNPIEAATAPGTSERRCGIRGSAQTFAITFSANVSRLRIFVSSGSVSGPMM